MSRPVPKAASTLTGTSGYWGGPAAGARRRARQCRWWAAEFAKARDCVMIELTTRAGNCAATLYERVGFAEVREIRNYVIAGDALDRLATTEPAPARMAGCRGVPRAPTQGTTPPPPSPTPP